MARSISFSFFWGATTRPGTPNKTVVTMMRDPYKVLGVKRDAGADEIKAAWRQPRQGRASDHNIGDPTATERFAEIGRAYETLKDPQKRSPRYDQSGAHGRSERQSKEQTIMQQRQAAREAAEHVPQAARANAENDTGRACPRHTLRRRKKAARSRQSAGRRVRQVTRGYGQSAFSAPKAARAAPSQAEAVTDAAEAEKPREPISGETEEGVSGRGTARNRDRL